MDNSTLTITRQPTIKLHLTLIVHRKFQWKDSLRPIGDAVSDDFKDWDALTNLRVAEPKKQHPTSVFQSFLPNKPVAVGELWKVEPDGALELLPATAPQSESEYAY